ncbi:MAG: bifunctional phosphoribosyl-AMP cyclohydrolase/phosphoribosyl-ATP diphosphatase HisIE [Bacteroidales bacterium]
MDFDKLNGILPAIIQDASTRQVLMLGFMNREALEKTRSEGKVTFFSRTKNRLWTKGEESGNFLHVREILEDCDRDTLLIKVDPAGPVCHTGSETCFEESNRAGLAFLSSLQALIRQRREEMPEGSYTTSLFRKGINKIAQKVGEEAVELVIESKDDSKELFLNEAADLMYHLLVLLAAKDCDLTEVVDILEERHRPA